MSRFIAAICATLYCSGHNISPSALPNGSFASAYCGKRTTSHSSSSVLFARIDPIKSSSSHRVWFTTIDPVGRSRGLATAEYHSLICCLIVGLAASTASLCGSSIINRSAGHPVNPPPTPAVFIPPPAAVSHSSAACVLALKLTPIPGFANNTSLTCRPQYDALWSEYDANNILFSGHVARNHTGNHRLVISLFPVCGGIDINSRNALSLAIPNRSLKYSKCFATCHRPPLHRSATDPGVASHIFSNNPRSSPIPTSVIFYLFYPNLVREASTIPRPPTCSHAYPPPMYGPHASACSWTGAWRSCRLMDAANLRPSAVLRMTLSCWLMVVTWAGSAWFRDCQTSLNWGR